jgi:cellulose synthase/poly-beta-1,6-N-acetylglucosamine synthase-like glycosyltransferase
MHRVAIGTMVFNEAANLPRLLPRLSALGAPGVLVTDILVVCSGCSDDSEAHVRRAAQGDPRIRLVSEPRRRGKAAAINRFLALLPREVDSCVLVSADVLPAPDALGALLRPFADPRVGMTGGCPIPTNPATGLLHRVVRFQWAVHHRLATCSPKLGEMVAFRNVVNRIDSRTPVDEASLEAQIVEQGLLLAYAPEARVANRGPDNLAELLFQRQRIWNGHLKLRRDTGYEVASYRLRNVLPPVWDQVRAHPRDLPVAVAAGVIEGIARTLGTADQALLGRTPTTWRALPSTKQLAS